MRNLVPGRAFALASALATAGSFAAVALASPASAKPRTFVACAHLNAPAPKHHVTRAATLSGCTAPKATGGGGRINTLVTAPGSGHATIRWNKAGSTTIFDYKVFVDTDPDETRGCPAHTKEFVVMGQVSGGSGAAASLIPIGQPISAGICVSTKRLINEPGTKFKI